MALQVGVLIMSTSFLHVCLFSLTLKNYRTNGTSTRPLPAFMQLSGPTDEFEVALPRELVEISLTYFLSFILILYKR